ncbi:globin [Jeotgalibacillus sp. R-1-5s-1]|uniref:globin domain-containing protein n=1 Tax=Jeotgalibacillus sp. R-1-5s-1 TaxID=2555897 RepID=UPI001068F9C6|nr:globin [Jeotgalibacillus sp. R-1-5s-1]TFD97595.1 globin [Jeotgalibacillus sp. R-1-5s-1]
MAEQTETPYEMIGEAKLTELVHAFYEKVGNHPLLIPIFPDDLTETIRKQKQFLTQYLGGPAYYTEEHGHPMLRARHLPHEITPERAKAWLTCMDEAMTETGVEGEFRDFLFSRLTLTANHMVNTFPADEGDLD